jgi:hypothetical protein
MTMPVMAQELVSLPVECGSKEALSAMLKKYQEEPVMVLTSTRMIRQEVAEVPAVLFVNPVTTTWSLVEQVDDDVYCVVGQGDKARSHRAPGGN